MAYAFVYIMASRRNGTLYIGVTSDLVRRVYEHKISATDGFTSKHGVKKLVWYEAHDDIEAAIAREKAMKKWNRAWKLSVIEEMNPDWWDLFDKIVNQ